MTACNKFAFFLDFFTHAFKGRGHSIRQENQQAMQARTVETRVVKELSPEVMDAFKDARLLALDVEGVDLSREGACLF